MRGGIYKEQDPIGRGIVDTVGTVNLKYVLDQAKREQGTDEILFLRLNCEGCEFDVVPDPEFRELAASKGCVYP